MEAVFRQAKEEQETVDKAFEEQQQRSGGPSSEKLQTDSLLDPKVTENSVSNSKAKGPSTKASGKKGGPLLAGSKVRVVSGTFAEFVGSLKKLNRKTGKATVAFTLFGKESLVDLDVKEIVAETE